jgi:hypothetical protein
MNQDGNTITWKMECDQQGQRMTSDGQIIYPFSTSLSFFLAVCSSCLKIVDSRKLILAVIAFGY